MRILVTGGGGFLGTWIIQALIKEGHDVVNFSRHEYEHLKALGIKSFKGTITHDEDLQNALIGIDAVFHVAAIAGVWGKHQDFYNTNYLGTKKILEIARSRGVKYFIYTSTPSVVFGKDDIIKGDESLPYPDKFYTSYAMTKAMAEEEVLNSNSNEMKTIAIRPHLIWGPGDPHLFPRVIQSARAGKLKRVGNGDNLVDIIYVENAAHAHLLALKSLMSGLNPGGRAYFIGQERPVNLWDFINEILRYSKIEPIEDSISFKKAYTIGAFLEWSFKTIGIYKPEPPMTRFVAMQLAKSHYFSQARAINDLGYFPAISIEEGLKRTFQFKSKLSSLTGPNP